MFQKDDVFWFPPGTFFHAFNRRWLLITRSRNILSASDVQGIAYINTTKRL
nr:hypothetical protein [Staphylococcus epidermidis]